MAIQKIFRAQRFKGKPLVPGDKSISHRGLLFGAMAEGTTKVTDILESEDVQSTERCLRQMGVQISKKGNLTFVEGVGQHGFKQPKYPLDCANSGTTLRSLMGLMAGQGIRVNMTGDSSLSRRPMKRVAEPLRMMGAQINLTQENFAPLNIEGRKLKGIEYELKIASAQIKTAILLAGLSAEGLTRITGEILSRDHTERMLEYFGAKMIVTHSPHHNSVEIEGGQILHASEVQVPSDPSTAAFWIAAAVLIKGSHLEIENILLNPTRIGFLRVLERMGANFKIFTKIKNPEPIGTIQTEFSKLMGVIVSKEEVPSLIDEIPMLAVLATQAHGATEVFGAEELRVKESDRLEAVALNLRAMGCEIELRHDGFKIEGPQKLYGANIKSFHDHRIAMAFSIAGLLAEGDTVIEDSECVAISYPEFYKTLAELIR